MATFLAFPPEERREPCDELRGDPVLLAGALEEDEGGGGLRCLSKSLVLTLIREGCKLKSIRWGTDEAARDLAALQEV